MPNFNKKGWNKSINYFHKEYNLSKYEKLIIYLEREGIKVYELDVEPGIPYAKYVDGHIGINRNIPESLKIELIVEELGHHRKTYGNITDLTNIKNLKLEIIARREGHNILLHPDDLLKPLSKGARNIHEFSEHLNISEERLLEIIKYWKNIHGHGIHIGDYYLNLLQM